MLFNQLIQISQYQSWVCSHGARSCLSLSAIFQGDALTYCPWHDQVSHMHPCAPLKHGHACPGIPCFILNCIVISCKSCRGRYLPTMSLHRRGRGARVAALLPPRSQSLANQFTKSCMPACWEADSMGPNQHLLSTNVWSPIRVSRSHQGDAAPTQHQRMEPPSYH